MIVTAVSLGSSGSRMRDDARYAVAVECQHVRAVADYREALEHAVRANELYEWARDSIGQEALAICREIGDRPNETETLVHIGDAALAGGDADGARAAWESTLSIRVEIAHPDTPIIREKLDNLYGVRP